MSDYPSLAALSHGLDRLALALALDDPDDDRAVSELLAVSEGQKEALAIALSYALRRRELGGHDDVVVRAISLLTVAVRRTRGGPIDLR